MNRGCFMFDTKLDICSNGYDIEQTNLYLKNLQNKIDLLEKRNEYLFKSFASLITLESKIDLILKHLNIDFCDNTVDSEKVNPNENESECFTIKEEATEETKASSIDLSFLRNEINALKSYLKD